ncbi:MAG TPA: hypothetical protein VJP04_02570 [Terriglobales bacterium]|nr:hypothetical protein [Terriglobales bacterium]
MSNQLKTAPASLIEHRSRSEELSTRWFESAWFHLALFVTACAVLISRRPEVVFHAQFWAEDGTRWYADAYRYGIHSLLMTSVGYLVTLQRIVALIVKWGPMRQAPLLFNVSAIVVQVLPVSLFLSRRYMFVGNMPTRLLLSFVYVGLPNTTEINANLTNSQWHLALLACMVLLAPPATSRAWAVFDFTVMLLLALTGPFSILLLPLAVVVYCKKPSRHEIGLLGVLAGGTCVQLLAFLGSVRVLGPSGASWRQFIRIAGHQVFLSALFGKTGLWLPDPQPRWYFFLLLLVVLLGTGAMSYALARGPLELKLFILFSVAVFASALKSPMGSWPVLHLPGAAQRYWFFPMMAFLASLFWLVFGDLVPRKLKVAASLVALTMCIGISRDWRDRPFVDMHFGQYAERFSTLPSGTQYVIPINPPGWTMVLVKK